MVGLATPTAVSESFF